VLGLVTERDVHETGLLWMSFLGSLFITHEGRCCRCWRSSFTNVRTTCNANCTS